MSWRHKVVDKKDWGDVDDRWKSKMIEKVAVDHVLDTK